MTDLGDVRIQRTGEPPDPGEPPRRFPVIPVAIVAVLLMGAGYFYLRKGSSDQQPARTQTEQQVSPGPPAKLAAEPGDNIVLPPLDDSDALVRELVARLSAHPRVAAWLTTDQLIRNFTVVVLNIAEGRSPATHLRRIAPSGRFQAIEGAQIVRIDPRSFHRYDPHANAVAGIDARGAARLYATLKPRIDEAYRELGAPHGDFDRTLERAIAHLLQTPALPDAVAVEPVPGGFAFADPSLESLSRSQKQLLRMGPSNMRIVQSKLREIAPYLGLAPSSR
jgi:Protein of unknown function (DUF3014)